MLEAINNVDAHIGEQVLALEGLYDRTFETLQNMQLAAEAIGEAAAPFADAGQVVAAANQIVATAGQVVADGIQAAGEQTLTAANQLSQVQTHSQELAQTLTTTLKELRITWEAHERRFQDVDQHLEQTTRALVNQIAAVSQEANDFLVGIDAQLAQAVNRFGGSIKEIGEIVEELQDIGGQLVQARQGVPPQHRGR